MIIYINDKKIELTAEELEYRFLGEGKEGTTYIWNDKVLKIYKPYSSISRLNEKEAIYLSKIPTKRILLPIDLIYDENHNFIGYTTKFIRNYNRSTIKRLAISKIKEELEIIKEDIFLLSEKNISLEDFKLDNFAYDGKFYMIDPGTYKIVDYDKKKVYLENIKLYSDFFLREVLFTIVNLTKKEKNNLESLNDSSDYIGDILENSDRKVVPFIKGISK